MVQEALNPCTILTNKKQIRKNMEKKNYVAPELEMMEMETVGFFAASSDFSDNESSKGGVEIGRAHV